MHRPVRLDFTDNGSAKGYMVTLNGRPVRDRFTNLYEVLAFARSLGTRARYAGRCPDGLIAEGGQLQGDDENFVS